MKLDHSRHLPTLVAIAFSALLSACGGGGSTAPDPSAQLAAQLQPIADAGVKSDPSVPSVLLAVSVKGDSVAASVAAGVRAPGTTDPARATDQMHVASVGKMFTAATVLRLAEGAKLSLDDSIARYLPAAIIKGLLVLNGVDRSSEITVRQLLSHTSGLPDYFEDGTLVDGLSPFKQGLLADPQRHWSAEDTIAWTKANLTPIDEPGSVFHYADTNYQLLGLIVQNVTGTSLESAARSLVFDPLGMTSTYMEYTEAPRRGAGVALTHYLSGSIDLAGVPAISSDWAGGGWATTSADLIRFLRGLFGGKLYKSASTLEQMKTVTAQSQAADEPYGLGLRFQGSTTTPLYGHFGYFSSFAFYDLANDIAVVGTLNQSDTLPTTFDDTIKKAYEAALAASK